MKQFLDENFLLSNAVSESLYHEIAKDLPIIDFHNHLNPADLARDVQFENIAKLWVNSDPYKHRAMRLNGIPENEITGDVSDKTKFLNWAKTLPHTLGNPLFHWSCLELKYVFGIDEVLSEANAEKIWDCCNEKLQQKEWSAVNISRRFKPEILCTSDTLTDDLSKHQEASETAGDYQVWPSLRGDNMLAFDNIDFINGLQGLNGSISQLADYQQVIIHQLDRFSAAGCRLADHALNSGFSFELPSESESERLFKDLVNKHPLDQEGVRKLQSYLLVFLGKEYGKRNWIMQLHIGAQRATSYRLKRLAGGNGGYACIGNSTDIFSLIQLLNSLEKDDFLPRTILYNLNPNDNEMLGSLTGSFTEDNLAGKIQLGPAWWYNDHLDGIEKQLKAVANHSLLSRFIGMTTDSRSILSLSRHDYFRRILCDVLGKWAEAGEVPYDMELLGSIIKNISFENSKKWLLNN